MEEGRLEKIWENETRDGQSYWVLKIDGQRYSVFDEDAVRELKEGDQVEFEWKKSGRYRNVTSLRTSDNGRPMQENQPYDRELSIVRMSCLRSASELLAYEKVAADKKADLALDLARRFEEYVLGP